MWVKKQQLELDMEQWTGSKLGKEYIPDSSVGKESTCNAGDPVLIPGLGRSSGQGNRPPTPVFLGFPGGSDSNESTCHAGDLGLIPGLGGSPGKGHGNPLQYSCLEKPMDREEPGRLYSPWGHKELDTTEQLSIAHSTA